MKILNYELVNLMLLLNEKEIHLFEGQEMLLEPKW